ncbi:MAG: alanyl-tRNA editing protein [Dactylosporangium sp.]|nr:alanyl-tRNA editing protein [Dactylosporangium sp.]NNJ62076.1 alanyl-tRNA editing protein [Dactylosporangium sp.]
MTETYFQTDAYRWEFGSSVAAREDNRIALDATAFYPGGGGQPHDVGTITADGAGWQVVAMERDDDRIWHVLDRAAPDVGTPVHGQVDRDRRYALMRTHTAMHILCGVIFRDHGASVTGGNMEPLRGRMDFEFETMRQELIRDIEEAVNREVAQNRPIRVQILPREDALRIPDLIRTRISLLPPEIAEIRTVDIVGLDLQADGGTHVANTSEVGPIRITRYKSKGKINKRIELALDERPAP